LPNTLNVSLEMIARQPVMSVLDTPPQDEVVTTITATTHVELPLHPKKPTYDELNPKSSPTEFLGPWGTLAVTLLTPLFCNLLFIGCNERTGCPPSWNRAEGRLEFSRYDFSLMVDKLFDGKAFLVYIGWYTYMVLCWAYIPGDWVEGTLMRNGKKQMYKINGEFKEASGLSDHMRIVAICG
jgi:delta14-sterol reductase